MTTKTDSEAVAAAMTPNQVLDRVREVPTSGGGFRFKLQNAVLREDYTQPGALRYLLSNARLLDAVSQAEAVATHTAWGL